MKDNFTRIGLLALSAWASGSAGSAAAQSCETNADCAPGFECEAYTVGWCSGGCPVDGPCPEPTCGEETYYACAPAECESDADCGGQMVCHTRTMVSCSGRPTCAPDSPCDEEVEPHECVETAESRCAYRWEVPCEADADCGPGFACRTYNEWACDPWPAKPDGERDGDDRPDCYEISAGKHCELLDLPCESDADCDEGLVCADAPSWGCGGSDPGGDTPDWPGDTTPPPLEDAASVPDESGPSDKPRNVVDGGAAEPCPPPPPAARRCEPPEWSAGGGGGGSPGHPGHDGAGDSDGAPDDGNGDNEEPNASPGGGTPPTDPDSAEGDSGHGRGLLHFLRKLLGKGLGCSVASGSSSGVADLSWLALLGVLGATRRRRR